jgi:hypothetical protein
MIITASIPPSGTRKLTKGNVVKTAKLLQILSFLYTPELHISIRLFYEEFTPLFERDNDLSLHSFNVTSLSSILLIDTFWYPKTISILVRFDIY